MQYEFTKSVVVSGATPPPPPFSSPPPSLLARSFPLPPSVPHSLTHSLLPSLPSSQPSTWLLSFLPCVLYSALPLTLGPSSSAKQLQGDVPIIRRAQFCCFVRRNQQGARTQELKPMFAPLHPSLHISAASPISALPSKTTPLGTRPIQGSAGHSMAQSDHAESRDGARGRP